MHEFHGVLDSAGKVPHSISHQFKKCGVEHSLSANICIKIFVFFFLFWIHLLCCALHVWAGTQRKIERANERVERRIKNSSWIGIFRRACSLQVAASRLQLKVEFIFRINRLNSRFVCITAAGRLFRFNFCERLTCLFALYAFNLQRILNDKAKTVGLRK